MVWIHGGGFTFGSGGWPQFDGANVAKRGGATHGAEIPYVFDHVKAAPSQYESRDEALSQTMAAMWVQFAKTGNPNGVGLSSWPRYRAPQCTVLDFGDATTVGSDSRSAQVEFFRGVFEKMRALLPH
jgi:para-nitrobenzyl esterase